MPSIGEAARLSGVAVETIRYYERSGVVPLPQRSATGRRDYSNADIARLRLIRHCRDLGFPLADARALLALSEESTAPCAEVRVIAEAHLADVRRKIRHLRDLENALATLVRDCKAGADPCPVLRALTTP